MSNLALPRKAPLRQHGGLWESAYHLYHPRVTADPDVEYARGSITNHTPDLFVSDEAYNFSDETPPVLDWSDPFNPLGPDSVDNEGNPVAARPQQPIIFRPGDDIHYLQWCADNPGIFNPKCVPDWTDPVPPFVDDPATLDPPGGPGVPVPCAPVTPPVIDTVKRGKIEFFEGLTNGRAIYTGADKSTFNYFNPEMDLWEHSILELQRRRSCTLEDMLVNGTGLTDIYGRPRFGQLAGANLSPEGNIMLDQGRQGAVRILAGGTPVDVRDGLAQLEDSLAECLCGEIGMIHAAPSVVLSHCDCFYVDNVDYGDGMGVRKLYRTKTRGNIVVPGGGYCGALDPYGCPADPNSMWLYATPMVYLAWDHIRLLPNRQEPAQGTLRESNDLTVIAEQVVAPFFNDCCKFAIQVTIC